MRTGTQTDSNGFESHTECGIYYCYWRPREGTLSANASSKLMGFSESGLKHDSSANKMQTTSEVLIEITWRAANFCSSTRCLAIVTPELSRIPPHSTAPDNKSKRIPCTAPLSSQTHVIADCYLSQRYSEAFVLNTCPLVRQLLTIASDWMKSPAIGSCNYFCKQLDKYSPVDINKTYCLCQP